MTKFSQGKWYVDTAGVVRCHNEYERSIALLITSDATKELDDANARLIIAAPEMYELLTLFVKEPSEDAGDNFDRFVIALEEGRQLLSRIDRKEDVMSEFSQGVWTYNPLTGKVYIVGNKATYGWDISIANVDYEGVAYGDQTVEECHANGRLIAEAPEMFRLLEDYLNPKLHARSKDYHDLLERTVTLLNRVIGKEENE